MEKTQLCVFSFAGARAATKSKMLVRGDNGFNGTDVWLPHLI